MEAFIAEAQKSRYYENINFAYDIFILDPVNLLLQK